MEQIRAALIGYGGMGRKYAKILTSGQAEGMTLAGICCRNEKGQAEIRKMYPELSVYRDIEDTMAHGEEFDAVIIVTPHTSHVEIGKAAARGKKHILMDKPAGVNTKEVKELLEEVKKAGVSFGMVFHVRAKPAFIKAKEMLEEGCVGRLQRVVWICNTWYRTPAYHRSAPWRSTWKGECGGLLINQSQHYFDIWQWLFGMPDQVRSVLDYGKYSDIQVDDSGDIQFYYENGLHGTFISSTGENPGVNRMEIWGTRGRLTIEDTCRLTLDLNEVDTETFSRNNQEVYGKLEHRAIEIPVSGDSEESYVPVFKNFASHLIKGTPLMADGEDGLKSIMMANGAYLSSWLDRCVSFPIDDDLYADMLRRKREQTACDQHLTHNNRKGCLFCVSTGPGDPELMTLKAVRITGQCPVVALSVDGTRRDRLHMEDKTPVNEQGLKDNCVAYQIARPVVPSLDEKAFLYLNMPMTKDQELVQRSHESAAEAIVKCLEAGKDVAWLTLGDATVYATSMYVAERVKALGYEIQIISGVPSFCAAAASLGRSLVSGSEELHVIPSSYEIEEALSYPGTKVLMKAGSRIREVKALLKEKGCPTEGVERCGMDGERLYKSAEELEEKAGYYTVLIVK